MIWYKKTPVENQICSMEYWTYINSDEVVNCIVDVKRGKPFDVVGLKLQTIENINKKILDISSSRIELYGKKEKLHSVEKCPVCDHSKSELTVEIYNAEYHKCNQCSHYFVKFRPTDESIKNFYRKNTAYQKEYADVSNIEKRINEIALPKAKWTISNYRNIYGKNPTKVLDIGAGSGHFVKACKKLGINCHGVEISESGVRFAKNHMGINLLQIDFLNEWQSLDMYDIVTFWGVIEHVPKPVKMLIAGKQVIGEDGMIAVGVPRWDSVSTAVQAQYPNSVIRHLDPLGHINCFSDSSLATALLISGFYPRSAWYFGMDFYELLIQLSLTIDNTNLLSKNKKIISNMQNHLDMGLLSDSMAFLGTTKNLFNDRSNEF